MYVYIYIYIYIYVYILGISLVGYIKIYGPWSLQPPKVTVNLKSYCKNIQSKTKNKIK